MKIISLLFIGLLVLPYGELHAQMLGREAQKAVVPSTDDAPWVMAYYVGYQNGYLKPKDVDYSLMTHIVVGGVGVEADGSLDEHWHLPNGDGKAMARDVVRRAQRAGVKTLVWLGGPNEEDKLFAATDNKVRKNTVDNIRALVDEYGFDGVDIDWEPVRAKDEPRLLALVKDLREARPDLLITVPVNWVPLTIVGKKDLSMYAELATYADRLFIMSYSMSGSWSGWRTWHSSALYGATLTTPSSVDSSVMAYLKAGVPSERLGIGVGTYATCFTYPVKKPSTAYPKGYSPAKTTVMSTRTMMDDYYSKKYEKWDDRANVPYLSFNKARGANKCGMISFENKRSLAEKARYVNEQGLGGMLVWNIGTGYFPEASRSKRHDLLRAVFETVDR